MGVGTDTLAAGTAPRPLLPRVGFAGLQSALTPGLECRLPGRGAPSLFCPLALGRWCKIALTARPCPVTRGGRGGVEMRQVLLEGSPGTRFAHGRRLPGQSAQSAWSPRHGRPGSNTAPRRGWGSRSGSEEDTSVLGTWEPRMSLSSQRQCPASGHRREESRWVSAAELPGAGWQGPR